MMMIIMMQGITQVITLIVTIREFKDVAFEDVVFDKNSSVAPY